MVDATTNFQVHSLIKRVFLNSTFFSLSNIKQIFVDFFPFP